MLRLNILLIFVLLTFMLNAQSGNRTLNTEVSLKVESISKSALLDTLSSMYDLYFSYNPVLLQADKLIKLNLKNEPLYTVLNHLINTDSINFKAFNNQIIFFPLHVEVETEKLPSYKIIKGKVADFKKNSPIPYCNITLVGKGLGTMSNNNGQFTIKIPEVYWNDTLGFSCLGYEASFQPILEVSGEEFQIQLKKKTYSLKEIDIIRYDPEFILDKMDKNRSQNYEKEYTLLTTYYRELTMENLEYTDISEAVLQVMKAPYSNQLKDDHVKFIKGRKGADLRPLNDIRFKLMGGPYYITKLDVIKNNESFLNPELRHLYEYKFENITLINNRETAVLSFNPIYNLRDILYEGSLYIDIETWAISRIDFNYTKQGLKSSRNSLIHKEPKKCKAIPTELTYIIKYIMVDGKWHLQSAQSSLKIKINNKEKKVKTNFHSISEILTTNIEKGDLQHFGRKEIFKSNEIFTDIIVSYDKSFWENYNVIEPEEKLIKALKHFDNQNLIITYKN